MTARSWIGTRHPYPPRVGSHETGAESRRRRTILRVVSLPGILVDAHWLATEAGRPGLVVADVRWHPEGDGREAYERAHLPGAVFLDADADLAGVPFEDGPGRHPLPRPEAFAEVMSAAGIGDGDDVVAYDDVGGSYAARLWWMRRALGRSCGVLDGGLSAWGGELEAGAVTRARVESTPKPWPADRLVDAASVRAAIRERSAIVLDARAEERYRGDVEPIDPVAGHIPGALSAAWAGNLDPTTGRFLSGAELRRRYEALGVRTGRDAIASCGSGLTATHDILAMDLAGLEGGRLYEGSWSGWIADVVAAGEPDAVRRGPAP
jgi:thiosulfate/3-mercaptopyruvate sulfurtransferase